MRHGLSQPSALPCISRPSSFLGSISTPAPPAPYTRPAIPCVCLGRVPHAHSPHTACTHTEQVACLPPRHCHPRPRTPRGPRPRPPLPTGGWRARAHPPACNLPVAGCGAPASTQAAGGEAEPSGPSERPPATASGCGSSKPAGSGLQLHVSLASGRGAVLLDCVEGVSKGAGCSYILQLSPFSGRPFNV